MLISYHSTNININHCIDGIKDEPYCFFLCLCSSLARALQPSLLMQMKLSDGSLQRFEVLQNCLYFVIFPKNSIDRFISDELKLCLRT